MEAKKRTLEKQLESRKRNSTFVDETADISMMNASQDASRLKASRTPEELEKLAEKLKNDIQQAENASTPNFSTRSFRNSFHSQRIENARKELDTSMNLITDNKRSISPGTQRRLEASPPQFSTRKSNLKTPVHHYR